MKSLKHEKINKTHCSDFFSLIRCIYLSCAGVFIYMQLYKLSYEFVPDELSDRGFDIAVEVN